MNKNSKKAVSLLEILISAILLSLVVGGFVSVFFTVREYIRHAKERSTASDLGYSHSRILYKDVRDDTWRSPSSNLAVGRRLLPLSGSWSDIDNINYESSNTRYRVRPVAGQDYRQVEITVEYPD